MKASTESKNARLVGGIKFEIMTEEQFNKIVEDRIAKIRELLVVKGKEYRRNNDVFHNFNSAARVENITPQRALHGFFLKHFVSYQDLLNDLDKGKCPSAELIDEKLGDIIVYMILQEALLKEKAIYF